MSVDRVDEELRLLQGPGPTLPVRLHAEIALARGCPGAIQTRGEVYPQTLDLAEQLWMRPLVAHCHLGLGKLYHSVSDGAKAGEHVTTEAAMYGEMEMGFWLEKAGADAPGIGQAAADRQRHAQPARWWAPPAD